MEKLKNYLIYAFLIFLFIMGVFYLFRSMYIFADDYEYTEKSLIEIHQFYTCKMLRYSEYKYYMKLRDEHLEKAFYHYNQSYLACWYCPRITDQEKARACLTSLWASFGATTPNMKFVAALGALLLQYGLECMREWHFVKTNLYESQHHFEMYEFYNELLAKA